MLVLYFSTHITDKFQMADLKENIENEIHSAHDEFLKMDSHIKLYITEMEQSIYA
jgi:kinetochore protein Nuf2